MRTSERGPLQEQAGYDNSAQVTLTSFLLELQAHPYISHRTDACVKHTSDKRVQILSGWI